jgi:cytochrome c
MIEPKQLHERAGLPAAMSIADFLGAGLKLLLVVALVNVRLALADDPQDQAMRKLASASSCALCHSEEPRKAGTDELLPIGPSWKEIARRYRGQPNAEDRLTNVVVSGSGPGPKDRHWANKASGVSMPPNTVEISPEDASKLVRWILAR